MWGGVAAAAVIAHHPFGDALTVTMMCGIGLIIAGVLTIELAGAVR